MGRKARILGATMMGLAMATAGGCSRTPKLDGAKVDIPVFSPSTLEDESTATTSDDLHDISKFRTHSWTLSTSATWESVDAFYRERLASATRRDETTPRAPDEAEREPEVVFMWIPPDWKSGAGVWITIDKRRENDKTKIHISQDVLNH